MAGVRRGRPDDDSACSLSERSGQVILYIILAVLFVSALFAYTRMRSKRLRG